MQETIGQACAAASNYTALLMNDPITLGLFGSNATALVRMLDANANSKGAVFALTDGESVVYVQENPLVKLYAPRIWPFAVNPRFGIARMWLPAQNDAALFGCACEDVATPTSSTAKQYSPTMVRLTCAAVVGTNPAKVAAYTVPIEFDAPYEPQWLGTCDRVRVNVQSLRWQVPRAVAQLVGGGGGGNLPTTTTGDAAVWLTPVCGAQNGIQGLACLSDHIFLLGNCYPYCLAVHLQSDGLDRPLRARGASEWTSGVLLAARDCSSSSTTTSSTSSSTVCTVSADASGAPLPQQGAATPTQCAYASTCTSFITNRTRFAQYAPNASLGSHLIAQGQPLVLAGGVAMVETVGGTRMDFPALVGQTDGEFTVETLTPQGVPVGAPPPTPSMLAPHIAAQASIDSPPPAYVQANGVVPVNPGTLLRDGSLLYVSNPSYDQLAAFTAYCASRGAVAETQLMLLSNFQSLRVQRVRSPGDACFTFSNNAAYVCRPDLFAAAPIGDRPVPALSSEQVRTTSALYDLCVSGATFDLYAEWVEWFDDANVVVAMRRGTVADLARLGSGGRTVFYFVQQADVSLARLGMPWSSSVTNSTRMFQTCSALRALPDVGAVWGRSLAALLELAAVPVNAAFNPFAFVELLDARAAYTCPEDGLAHSALGDCGAALYSLEAAFAQTYAASSAWWDMLAWFVSLVLPASAPSELSDFLSGGAVLGDATRINGFYGVPQAMAFADLHAETLLESAASEVRRRHLLGAAALLRHTQGAMRLGVRGFMGLARGLMQLVASGSTFSGADLAAVISSQGPPTTLAADLLTAPPVAWSHFTYRVLAPAVVDVVACVRAGNPSAIAPLFLYVQTAMDAFDAIVHTRHSQACTGVRFMVGYDSSLGLWLYNNCLAGKPYARIGRRAHVVWLTTRV